MAAAFGAAAALISIGKSCGLQDLRPIVDGSSSVVLRPVQQEGDAEATHEERASLRDRLQLSMCGNHNP